MASTYTTGFGIEKIGTGEQAGAWGTTTNHNADILDRIASYKAVGLSGTTHTLTVREASPGSGTENLQDGMYRVIKFTGALGGNNTVTIAPNTAPAYFIIENATTDSGSSGPYSVILTQGSGANVTVQNGKNAIIYCDGAGSGAVVYDALADLQVGTLEVTGVAAIDGLLTAGASVAATGNVTATGTVEPAGDTSAADNAAIGYTAAEGLILTGQGSTNDVTIKNDADAEVMGVLTGTTTAAFTGQITATGFTGTLDGILGSGAAAAATVTTLTTSGIASIDDTTDTTSGTSGSIHTDGGLGVVKAVFIGGKTTTADLSVSSTGNVIPSIITASGNAVGLDIQQSGAALWQIGAGVGDGSTNFNLYSSLSGTTGVRVAVTSAGLVGIGTTPSHSLQVAAGADTDAMYLDVNGNLFLTDGNVQITNPSGADQSALVVTQSHATALAATFTKGVSVTGHASIGANAVASTRALTVAGATDGTGSSIIVGYNSSLASKFSVRDDGYTVIAGGINVTGAITGDVVAVQSEMETATAVDAIVSPGRQQFHPSACKGWVKADTAAGIAASYNVASITDIATGRIIVVWATDFSSVNYSVVASAVRDTSLSATTTLTAQVRQSSFLATSVDVDVIDVAGTAFQDPAFTLVAAFGDQ